jgi:hypothetical protein
MDIDLDIDNYDLSDILKLFKLKYHFTEDDLKQSKRVVLKTHPDKSGLDKKYFLFFSKAYKLLYQIYTFRHKIIKPVDELDRDYDPEHDVETENEAIIDKIKKNKNFNRIFNEIFEKVYTDTSEGYSEWLKDESNDVKISCKTRGEMEAKMKNYKSKTLIVAEDIKEYYDSNGLTDLEGNGNCFSGNVFGKLAYDDIKHAHENSIINVNEDSHSKHKTLHNIKNERSQVIAPLNRTQQEKILKQANESVEKQGANTAFKLAKQTESYYHKNHEILSKFKQILN